jgi:hypothetical protein
LRARETIIKCQQKAKTVQKSHDTIRCSAQVGSVGRRPVDVADGGELVHFEIGKYAVKQANGLAFRIEDFGGKLTARVLTQTSQARLQLPNFP